MRRAESAGWLLLALSSTASAHVASADAVGFVSGLRHPVSGADHILAMIAVGLWGAQLGPPGIWLLPVTFPLVMACGGFLGLIGVDLPAAQIVIALSGICLGGCVMAQLRPPLWVAGVLVGIFGLFHGYAHGVELQQGENALFYSIGFVIATGLLHAAGVGVGVVHRWEWGRQALRGAGMMILGGGLYFMWTAVA